MSGPPAAPRRRRRVAVVTATLALVGIGGAVPGASGATTDGSLDKIYGTEGLAKVTLTGGDSISGSAVQPDGKVVGVGVHRTGPTTFNFLFVRVNRDGSADKTFGTDGLADLEFPGKDSRAVAVAVQPDGKIVAAGDDANATKFAVARLLADGKPDPTFGTGGELTIDFGATYQPAAAVALQPDGKIVLAGYSQTGATSTFALARLDPNGTLDNTFDGDGKVTVGAAAGNIEQARGVAVQADGKIVAVGRAGTAASSDFGFVRVTSLGQLDTTFNGTGKLAVDVGGTGDFAVSVVAQSNGKILAGGKNGTFPAEDMALVRVDGAGVLDPSFDTDGRVVVDFAGTDDTIQSIARQPDGGIVVLGRTGLPGAFHPAVARLRPNGSLDPAFGTDGKVTVDAKVAGDASPAGVSFAPDGNIVVGVNHTNVAVFARLSSNGFSAGGYWLVAADGGVFSYGSAAFHGSTGAIKLNRPIVGTAPSPTGSGYWFVASDGGIFNYGDAGFYGSAGAIKLAQPIVGMAATPTGRGYWLVASDGGIFNYGDATFFGSTGALKLNQPIVGMAATPSGHGYWLLARDGGIFGFGDAVFHGSTGNLKLNQPIVGMSTTPYGDGYWLVASDGGIFSFGAATFYGSTGAIKLNQPIVGMAANRTGRGYWLVARDGGIFSFGAATFYGSTGAIKLNQPIIGAAIR